MRQSPKDTAKRAAALIAAVGFLASCATSQQAQQAAVSSAETEVSDRSEVSPQGDQSTGAPEDAFEQAVSAATDPLSPKRLILVSRYGHERIVKFLLQNNVNVNAVDNVGDTALIAAAEGGHGNVVDMLIGAQADVNAQAPNGETALMAAATSGNVAIIRSLVAAEVDLDTKNDIGETALFNAVKFGHLDAARLLLTSGANPNIQSSQRAKANNSGYTPLMYAADHGNDTPGGDWVAMTNLLLEHGARPNIRNARGDSALSIAKRQFDPELVAILESAGARQERSYTSLDEDATLIKAARLGDIEKARSLLDKGAKPNVSDGTGVTPLLAAAFDNRVEVVELLIEKGADINLLPAGLRDWAFAASAASLRDHDLMESASRGDSALLVATRRGHTKVAEVLLAAGADPRLNNNRGDAPIFVAAANDRAKITEMLLNKGVDPNTLETEKLTVSMTNTLQTMGRNTPLIAAAQAGHKATAKVLLDAGADPNHQGFLNKTPLLWAAERGYSPIITLLLENGADPNLNDVQGLTPLMVAARNGNTRIAKALVAYEADPNTIQFSDAPGDGGKAFGATGMTALIYAARGGHDDIVRLLIDAGSNVNAMSRSGETAIKEASNNGYEDIVDLLEVAGAQ